MTRLKIAAFAVAGTFAALTTLPAHSAIRCKGAYQVIQGSLHATPFCGDNYLAEVARKSYGWKVSSRAVRNDPYLKKKLCLHFGHDIRVSNICAGLRQEDYGGGAGQ